MERSGSFSDISIAAPHLDIAAVNISAGHYNGHRRHEYARLDQMEENVFCVQDLLLTATERFPYMGYQTRRSARSRFGEEMPLWNMGFGTRKDLRALMEVPNTA